MYGPLMDFVRGSVADVLCFQEVFSSRERTECGKEARANLFSELERVLVGYVGLYAVSDVGKDFGGGVDFHLEYGQAMFVRRSIPVVEQGSVILLDEEEARRLGEMARVMQYVRLGVDGGSVMVCNLHGLWNRGPKTDSPERLVQAYRIKNFLQGVSGRVVVCGDFNLLPDTESLAVVGEGLRNLVVEYGIMSTRSSFYSKKWPQFADYVFVSSDVRVKNFEVLQDQVSDHLPLFLEFD